MRVLITGATGFIGQHLLEQLAEDDHVLRVISRKDHPEFWFTGKKTEIFKADLSDIKALERAFDGVDVVINLAAELKDKDKFLSANIIGVKNIIHLSKKMGVKRIIHLSSVGVVGAPFSSSRNIIDEQTPCRPGNEYERTKLESEKLLQQAFTDGTMKLFILRPTNVFGDQHPRKALLNFLSQVKQGRRIVFTKNTMVNYLYVKDLTACIAYFIKSKEKEVIFNVGHPESMEEFCSDCFDLLHVKRSFKNVPPFIFRMPALFGYFGMGSLRSKIRALSNANAYSDARLMKNWTYPYGVKEGLKRTIDYYRSKGLL